jgi:hypothetical protein
MEFLLHFVDIFINLDKHISLVLQTFGLWTYLIVFLIIFCETGLVVTPILPGDSLLFGLGTFAAPLDRAGNSVKGQLVAKFLSQQLGMDLFVSQPEK